MKTIQESWPEINLKPERRYDIPANPRQWSVKTIGDVPWTTEAQLDSLEEFLGIYSERPIKNNHGGVLAPHAFGLWFMARELAPDVIIESGVWRGMTTWLLEKACPDAQIYSFDIDLNLVRAYANGVTPDRHGFIHKDSDWDHAWTILYYANLIWKPNWRGETVFYTEGGKDTTDIVYPKPGRWVIFNSTQWHVGSPVTSFFRGLRITYAFKAFDRKITNDLLKAGKYPSKVHITDPNYDLADELKGVW